MLYSSGCPSPCGTSKCQNSPSKSEERTIKASSPWQYVSCIDFADINSAGFEGDSLLSKRCNGRSTTYSIPIIRSIGTRNHCRLEDSSHSVWVIPIGERCSDLPSHVHKMYFGHNLWNDIQFFILHCWLPATRLLFMLKVELSCIMICSFCETFGRPLHLNAPLVQTTQIHMSKMSWGGQEKHIWRCGRFMKCNNECNMLEWLGYSTNSLEMSKCFARCTTLMFREWWLFFMNGCW